MKQKDICNKKNLIFNNNPGYPEEAGNALRLIQEKRNLGLTMFDEEIALEKETMTHPKRDEIYSLRDITTLPPNLTLNEGCIIKLTTQDDSVAPADVIITDNGENNLPISVKKGNSNTCQSNISGNTYYKTLGCSVPENFIKEIPLICEKFVIEMKQVFGHYSKWFRKKKCTRLSHIKKDYEYKLILNACDVFNGCHDHNKRKALFIKALNIERPNYIICRYTKKGTIYEAPPSLEGINIDRIYAKPYKSFVGFYLNDVLLYKMQVKFNNGILERSEKTGRRDILIGDGYYASYGNPITSWNFSVVKRK